MPPAPAAPRWRSPRRSRRRTAGGPREGLAPVRMRIGINTGMVTAGNVGAPGRSNYGIVGDTVNTTQRIEQLAKLICPDQPTAAILVSARTRALAGPGFTFREAGAHEVRGRREPVMIYRLLDAVGVLPPSRRQSSSQRPGARRRLSWVGAIDRTYRRADALCSADRGAASAARSATARRYKGGWLPRNVAAAGIGAGPDLLAAVVLPHVATRRGGLRRCSPAARCTGGAARLLGRRGPRRRRPPARARRPIGRSAPATLVVVGSASRARST